MKTLILLLTSLELITSTITAVPHGIPPRPNVLFILTDDQRADAMGCAGHPFLKTPNIDRLAAEGVRFRNAFCTTSLCSPSRASILSGLYAHSHKVRDNFTEFPESLPVFPNASSSSDTKRRISASGTWAKTTTNAGRASTTL